MIQLAVGGALLGACVVVHLAVTILSVRTVGRWRRRPDNVRDMAVTMLAVAGLLAAAHLIEVALWAVTMVAVDGVPADDGIYFAFSSYTTLGYGDVVGKPEWRLLGPISAMSGILLFGWSSAILVHVLAQIVPRPEV